MKMKRVSEHIWSLKTWMIIPIHVWLVVDEEGVTLVDAGMPMMAKGILRSIKELNAGPLQRILLTHGHIDHVGAIEAILKQYNVPVYAHQIEIPYAEGELPYPKVKKVQKNLPKNVAHALEEDKTGDFKKFAGLTPFYAPGHSPGHVVYYHEGDQVLLAGDLFWSKKGMLKQPKFTPNMVQTVKSSVIVSKLKPKRLEVCHGGTVYQPAEQIDEYIRNMERKLGGKS